MCGICGIYCFDTKVDTSIINGMVKLMRHRGPDDEGYSLINTDNNDYISLHSNDTIEAIKSKTKNIYEINNYCYNLGFGFRRLSILDLTEHGHQPMLLKDAGLFIVFNGEIYNYLEIREELRSYGYTFFSNTDTEVILKSYHWWGVECVNKFNGMWAFALWDSKNRVLFCSRDRFGVKPFYYVYKPGFIFAFASEIKPLLLLNKPLENTKVILNSFIWGISNYDEETFFKNIFQLRGGYNLLVKNNELNISKYYSLPIQNEYDNFDKSKEKLKELLFDSVKLRLRSDVEVGYSLSGGIDSASVVCIANKLKVSGNNIFSVVFPHNKYDESKYIDIIIEKTNFKKHTIIPTFKDFIKDLDNFIFYIEEPFIGLSYYGEYKLRQLINSSNIKVCLDGQGSDEIFAGYPFLLNYYFIDLIKSLKIYRFNKEFRKFRKIYNNKFLDIFRVFLREDYSASIKFIKKKYPYLRELHILKNINNKNILKNTYMGNNFYSNLDNKLYNLLFKTSLLNLITIADKLSMAFSIETRFPFLDYRIIELAFNIPFHYKICNDYLKFILRDALRDIIPRDIYERKDKIGFVVPEENFTSREALEKFKNIVFALKGENEIIDMNVFKKLYFENNNNTIDWKFFKTFSYLLWYNRFIENNTLKNLA